MEKYIKQGFSYKTTSKLKGGQVMKEITILYHDLDIYYQLVNVRVDCDILFTNICENYIKDFLS